MSIMHVFCLSLRTTNVLPTKSAAGVHKGNSGL